MTETILNQRQQKVLERREGIIEQARALFIRQGLANVTMQDVMNETGIAKATMSLRLNKIRDGQVFVIVVIDVIGVIDDDNREASLKRLL